MARRPTRAGASDEYAMSGPAVAASKFDGPDLVADEPSYEAVRLRADAFRVGEMDTMLAYISIFWVGVFAVAIIVGVLGWAMALNVRPPIRILTLFDVLPWLAGGVVVFSAAIFAGTQYMVVRALRNEGQALSMEIGALGGYRYPKASS